MNTEYQCEACGYTTIDKPEDDRCPNCGSYTMGIVALSTDDVMGESLPDIDDGHVDMVNHPPHYTVHPSGVECIEITEHMGYCLGNAVKYIWRADLKGDAVEDLKKARFYLDREIAKREG